MSQSGRTFLDTCQAFFRKKDPHTISGMEVCYCHLNLMTLGFSYAVFCLNALKKHIKHVILLKNHWTKKAFSYNIYKGEWLIGLA